MLHLLPLASPYHLLPLPVDDSQVHLLTFHLCLTTSHFPQPISSHCTPPGIPFIALFWQSSISNSKRGPPCRNPAGWCLRAGMTGYVPWGAKVKDWGGTPKSTFPSVYSSCWEDNCFWIWLLIKEKGIIYNGAPVRFLEVYHMRKHIRP